MAFGLFFCERKRDLSQERGTKISLRGDMDYRGFNRILSLACIGGIWILGVFQGIGTGLFWRFGRWDF